jgi:hypothetical protein
MMARRDVTFRTVIPQDADEIERFFFELVEWVATGIEANAATDAPIGPTGKLANSIEKLPTRQMGSVIEGEVVATAEYAAYVNYGTGQAGAASSVPGRAEEISYSSGWRGMAARPFMSQAAEDGRIDLERGSTKLEGDLPKL